MRGFSTGLSISVHAAVGVAALFGTTKAGRLDPAPVVEQVMVLEPTPVAHAEKGGGVLPGPITIAPIDARSISVPVALPQTEALTGSLIQTFSPLPAGWGGAQPGTAGTPGIPEYNAEVITAPLPRYPDLLRQAGVQGRVVLEAIVDTTGRVLAQSILVVSATNPGFVAAARQALLASLFRPARVGGKAVPTRVRIPYEFAIRGTGRAR